MKPVKRILLLALIAALALGLSACGGKKTVEIKSVSLDDEKSVLMVEYVAKGDIPAAEGAFRISVSSGAGEVYNMSPLEEDLKKDTQHILMFRMRPVLVGTQIEWKVGKTIQLAGGTKITDTITTDDILKLFGDSAVVTAAFQVNGQTVAEKTLGE